MPSARWAVTSQMKKSIKTLEKYQSKTAVRIILSLLFLTLAAVFVIVLLPLVPSSEEQLKGSIARLEYDTYYEVSIDGQPAFYLTNYDNWTTCRLSTDANAIPKNSKVVHGTWIRRTFTPLCRGRLLTEGTNPKQWERTENAKIRETMMQQRPVVEQRITVLKKRIEELQYFLRVHKVMDEGYNDIADYESAAKADLEQTQKVLTILSDTNSFNKMRVRFIQEYTLLTDSVANRRRAACHILEMDAQRKTCVVQTRKHRKIRGARAVYDNSQSEAFRLTADSLLHQNTDTVNVFLAMNDSTYHGETNRLWIPEGHGVMEDTEGRTYDGMWHEGKRNGFGILLDANGMVRIGEWKDNVYQGERPIYTTEHIYGIDISRYQHDFGKKHYSIDWSKIRISHLGSKSNKRISGTVDYPVSFCYIKSTEGTTITNKYFVNDYKNARNHGIRCGAYHFFSTRTSGTQQANYFIQNTLFHPGDLPPVLDVEPSAALIKEMGGTEVLLNRIRVWMKAVENHLGVKPILYVSQNFINKYLADADDIKEEYQVWIARYGEYKPDVKLAIWQLSPDGHVNGIHGEVDINIFNGYRDRFDEFLERSCIRL